MTPLDYIRRGWRVVPVLPGEKVPGFVGWPDFKPTARNIDQFTGKNVALIVGSKSGETVDADLDCREAIQIADLYLPKTYAEFGRPSKPRSHRLYTAPGAIYEAFADPISGEMLLELRADGRTGGAHLTLLPPSITDGERRQWHGDIVAPAAIETRVLRRRVTCLAIGCLVSRYVSEHAAQRPAPDMPRLLWEFDHNLGRAACRWAGLPDPDAPQRYPRSRHELSKRDLDLAEIVAAIRNDCSWEDWNRIGMAIFAASGGSGDGFVVFDAFSSKSPKYNPHETQKRWFNYRRSPPSRIGLGTLVHLARQAGWRPDRQAS